MQKIQFTPIPTPIALAYQNGGLDANGQLPERHISDGDGVPCRHCLNQVAAGEPYLILAHRPFPTPQPYAETGPIFLHANACPSYKLGDTLPPMLGSPQYIIRGYTSTNRIIYGTGQIAATADIVTKATQLLAQPEVAYVHVRSATNNCFQCRVDRVPEV